MQCYVYRSSLRADTYLYLPEQDAFDDLPEGLLKLFGTPEFSLEFDLTPDRKLAQEDAAKVLDNLKTQGFHLQMPPAPGQPTAEELLARLANS
ncbi:MAG TPA: YcgL domain-containing protein [Thioalkalivibrio sp.]|nr:YcgL domain-containing protein [Thioalkalivibrio sp.]